VYSGEGQRSKHPTGTLYLLRIDHILLVKSISHPRRDVFLLPTYLISPKLATSHSKVKRFLENPEKNGDARIRVKP
jgi:hypothetical protein